MKKLFLAMILLASSTLGFSQSNAKVPLLVGSYNPAEEESIGVYEFDQETGEATLIRGIKGVDNPSFICFSAKGDIVYAVSEFDEPEPTAVHALRFDRTTGNMSLISTQMNHEGAPCNIILSPKEDYLVCANYWGGSMTIFGLEADGGLKEPVCIKYEGSGPHPNQTQPHVHAINFTPDGKYLLANDLGLDCIHVYPITNNDSLPLISTDGAYDVKVDAGAGPRHLCWSPDSRYAYVLAELSGQIFTLGYDGEKLSVVSSLVADTINGGGSADIHMTSDGEWLYASHRLKGDGISIYHVNKADGSLQRAGYQHTGIHPRNFAITPNDKYLLVACRDSNEIQIYERDRDTGLLTNTGKAIRFKRPVFINAITLNNGH